MTPEQVLMRELDRRGEEITRLQREVQWLREIVDTVPLPSSNKGAGEFYGRFYEWHDRVREDRRAARAIEEENNG